MFKRQRRNNPKVVWLLGAGVGLSVVGATASQTPVIEYLQDQFHGLTFQVGQNSSASLKLVPVPAGTSAIPKLVIKPIDQRHAELVKLTQSPASVDQFRARYLLASDLIAQNQPQAAIAYLENLEQDYPLLSPQVFYQRARAYELQGDRENAEKTWYSLLRRYPNHPVTVEALFALGKLDPKYWDEALEKFPQHPQSVEIALLRLRQAPEDPVPLLLTVARHGIYRPELLSILERLTKDHREALTPEDWEAIAFAYWEKQLYLPAGKAYANGPSTPRNLYRAARGFQLGEQDEEARRIYRLLYKTFPDAPETAQGLVYLGQLSQTQYAIEYLDTAIKKFPDKAGEAMLEKAEVLELVQNHKAALQARESVLSKYSATEAAAELRWDLALKRANAGNLEEAWRWAQELATKNPESELAPEAAYRVGRWAEQLGRSQDAKSAYEYVLSRYPESYFAWRSAVKLGWNVGDFTSVRRLQPQLQQLVTRPPLPVGSELLKELYLLGQNRDTWKLWQVEFENPMEPSMAEQFTDGLVRQGVGDYLDGIFMVGNLRQRDAASDRTQYQTLRQQAAYWQALYPFPYFDAIAAWSKQRQLNPFLVIALIRQESRFMPSIKSPVGATGLMQVMPETGSWIAKQINLKSYQLDNPQDNIKLGTWYLNFTHDQYNSNSLLAVASYNAGPGNVSDWINRFGFKDPDEFVDRIPFNETKGYVKSVFGNYWNYLRLYDPEIAQQLAQLPQVQTASFPIVRPNSPS